MAKNTTTNEVSVKRFFKIILKSVLILLGLFILFIIGIFATAPLFDKMDHDKFITLDNQMQGIYQKLKAASGGDDWKYEKICSAELAGDWPTGMYFCGVTMSLDKKATSVDDVNALQAKYYPIINSSDALKKKTELDPEYPRDFGKNFVISSAEKRYEESKTGVGCDYLIKVYSNIESNEFDSESYGSKIIPNMGRIRVSLDCTGKARSYWYPTDKITSLSI